MPRTIAIPLIVASLAVGASAMWIPAFDPFALGGPVSRRWPRLGIPERNGRADLSEVDIQFTWPPESCDLMLHGDGRGIVHGWRKGEGFCDGRVDLARERVESILDKLEDMDFMRTHHDCKRRMSCSWFALRFDLAVGPRRNRFEQVWFGVDADDPAEEARFHGRFAAVADEISDACGLEQWGEHGLDHWWANTRPTK